jgi:HAE1 family hydrophobic/amphiphilic exporter-1
VVYLYLDRAHYWFEARKAARRARKAATLLPAADAH